MEIGRFSSALKLRIFLHMKRFHISFLLLLLLISQPSFSQIHFNTLTRAYDKSGNKIGVHFISADITHGKGVLSIEGKEMKASITDSTKNVSYGIIGYALLLTTNSKKVNAAISKYNDGRYTVVINFADGEVRYDIDRPPLRLEDFAKTQSSKVTYDESFTPTLHLTFKNVSDKVITSVEVCVLFNKGLDAWDYRYPTRSYVIQRRINPGQYGTILVTSPQKIDGREPGQFYINKIRFDDGSICDR